MKTVRSLAITLAFCVIFGSAAAAPKVLSTSTGTVTGVLSYSAMQYWVKVENETLCVMTDSSGEEILQPLEGKKVTFTGPIQRWSDKKRCIVVNPNYPKEVK